MNTKRKERKPLYIGQQFGKLTVTGSGFKRDERMYYPCLCECGQVVDVFKHSLTSGNTKTCGCTRLQSIKAKIVTHGMTKSPTYNSWRAMTERCTNKNSDKYHNYGGRGITICAKWKSFDGFYEDMGERPVGTTLERVNCNLGYNRENCVWATSEVQATNRRKSSKNTSGRTGVVWLKRLNKWQASLRFRNELYYGGVFEHFDDAVAKREELELVHLGRTRPMAYEN